MNPIKDTILFKGVAPYLEMHPDNFAYQLLAIHRDDPTVVNWNRNNLDTAISWAHTPQGGDYWWKQHNQYMENKRKNIIIHRV